MKYIATTEADRFLMEKSLNKGQGVTFDIFDDPEEEEEPPEQYDDDGNVIPVVKKEPEPRTIFVPDLLMGPLSDRVVTLSHPSYPLQRCHHHHRVHIIALAIVVCWMD
jgi:hypothetical protein